MRPTSVECPPLMDWLAALPINPLPALDHPAAAQHDPALAFWMQRDLLAGHAGPVRALWALPEPVRLFAHQRPDGGWRYPGKPRGVPGQNYSLLETFRNLRVLVEQYGVTRAHPGMARAAEYVLGCQTDEGDIRGILGHQYMPYYHGALLELLVKAGYGRDPRVVRGMRWLVQCRQTDGGWVVPFQTIRQGRAGLWGGPALPANPCKPSSHLATGMALRALAAHPRFRRSAAAREAGELLLSRLFRRDRYPDRQAASYWIKFQYPFWWSNLLTALDTLSRLGFTRACPVVQSALDWFAAHQQADGLWPTGFGPFGRSVAREWIGLAICRVWMRLHTEEQAS